MKGWHSIAASCVAVVGIASPNPWGKLVCFVIALGLMVRGHFKGRA